MTLPLAASAAACDSFTTATPLESRLVTTLPDTLRQLIVSLVISPRPGATIELVIDAGTKESQRVLIPDTNPNGLTVDLGQGSYRIENPRELTQGWHSVRVSSDSAILLQRNVYVDVPTVEYQVFLLEDSGRGEVTVAAVDDSGNAVGWAESGGSQVPLAWRNQRVTILPIPSGHLSARATATYQGLIAGDVDRNAVVVWAGSSTQTFPTVKALPGAIARVTAVGFVEQGSIAAAHYTNPVGSDADGAIYRLDGSVVSLPFVPRGTSALRIVGVKSQAGGGQPRGAAWNTSWRSTPPTFENGDGYQELLLVNDQGLVVGHSDGRTVEPFLYEPGGLVTDLGPYTARRLAMIGLTSNRTLITSDGIVVRDARSSRIILPPPWRLVAITAVSSEGVLGATLFDLGKGLAFPALLVAPGGS